jgi:hypothetical protein
MVCVHNYNQHRHLWYVSIIVIINSSQIKSSKVNTKQGLDLHSIKQLEYKLKHIWCYLEFVQVKHTVYFHTWQPLARTVLEDGPGLQFQSLWRADCHNTVLHFTCGDEILAYCKRFVSWLYMYIQILQFKNMVKHKKQYHNEASVFKTSNNCKMPKNFNKKNGGALSPNQSILHTGNART